MEGKTTLITIPDTLQDYTGVANISQKGNRVIVMFKNGRYQETQVDFELTSWLSLYSTLEQLIQFLKIKMLNEDAPVLY